MFILIAMLSVLPGWQNGPLNETTPAGSSAPQAEGAQAPVSPTVEGLRNKVHKMRTDLLLGGEQVQRAESEAVDFYSQRLKLIDRRLDRIAVDLSEKHASYQLTLDRTLESPAGSRSRNMMQEASRLRSEIAVLENEASGLDAKRSQFAVLIDKISDRATSREALAANLAANETDDIGGGLPMSSIGFGPAVAEAPQASPFDDPTLVSELLSRDPRRGRAALYDADPVGYWNYFTLRPPASPLRQALEFPLPDLPGKR